MNPPLPILKRILQLPTINTPHHRLPIVTPTLIPPSSCTHLQSKFHFCWKHLRLSDHLMRCLPCSCAPKSSFWMLHLLYSSPNMKVKATKGQCVKLGRKLFDREPSGISRPKKKEGGAFCAPPSLQLSHYSISAKLNFNLIFILSCIYDSSDARRETFIFNSHLSKEEALVEWHFPNEPFCSFNY